jgi:hypothetical protein
VTFSDVGSTPTASTNPSLRAVDRTAAAAVRPGLISDLRMRVFFGEKQKGSREGLPLTGSVLAINLLLYVAIEPNKKNDDIGRV